MTGPTVAAGTPVFSDASYVPQIVQGQNATSVGDDYLTKGVDRNLSVTTGLTGKLASFDWNIFYSHQESRVDVNDPNNTNNARYLAAQDAVVAPAGTTVNGVQCRRHNPVLGRDPGRLCRALCGLRADQPVQSGPGHFAGRFQLCEDRIPFGT